MKLILTREVAGLGLAGDIVEVADGYGRNFLVPRGAAICWTQGRREADRPDQARARRPRDPRPRPRPRDQGRPREAVRLARRPRRQGRPAVRLDHRGRHRRRGEGRRRPGCWTASASRSTATSRRPARTPSPSTCTRTSSPRCPVTRRTPSDRAPAHAVLVAGPGNRRRSSGPRVPSRALRACATRAADTLTGATQNCPVHISVHRPSDTGARLISGAEGASAACRPQRCPQPVFYRPRGDSHRLSTAPCTASICAGRGAWP